MLDVRRFLNPANGAVNLADIEDSKFEAGIE
jgi:hypothetical protein